MFIFGIVYVVIGTVLRIGNPLCFSLGFVVEIYVIHLLAHSHQVYRSTRGLSSNVLLTVIISQRGNIHCAHYHLLLVWL